MTELEIEVGKVVRKILAVDTEMGPHTLSAVAEDIAVGLCSTFEIVKKED